MFDFNCDLTTEIKKEIETAKWMSSVNISAGLVNSNPLSVKQAIDYALTREISPGALVSYPVELELTEQNLEAYIGYQICAVQAFLKVYGLELENLRFEGILKEKLNKDFDFAKRIAMIVKKINPWLNIFVNNFEIKSFLEKELKAKCAMEVDFGDKSSIREIREMPYLPETIHFNDPVNATRAYDVIKPSPVNYNRIAKEM